MTAPKNPTIPHTKLLQLLRYEPDTGHFYWLQDRRKVKAGDRAGSLQHDGYIHIGICGRYCTAGRVAHFYMTGEWPAVLIDHENRIRSDNRWSNIRPATHAINQHNLKKPSNNKSGVKGVCWNKQINKWMAYITAHHETMYLGVFSTVEEAAAVRRAAEPQYHPTVPEMHRI